MLRFLPQILGLVAVLGVGGWVWSLKASNDRLRVENTALTSQVETLTFNAEQKAKAIETLNQEAERQRQETEALRSSVEDFLKGQENVEIPGNIADFLNSLHPAD